MGGYLVTGIGLLTLVVGVVLWYIPKRGPNQTFVFVFILIDNIHGYLCTFIQNY